MKSQPQALLTQRMQLLHRLVPQVRRHFHELELRCDEVLRMADSMDAQSVDEALRFVGRFVESDILALHKQAEPLAQINDALGRTTLAGQGDLAAYVGGTPAYAGLNWLLTPALLELWFQMWDSGRWQRDSRSDLTSDIRVHLNLVRSKVLQQCDLRLRETQHTLWHLAQAS